MIREIVRDIGIDRIPPQYAVALLCFVAVVFVGSGLLLLREQYRHALHRRLATVPSAGTRPQSAARKSRFLQFLERIGNIISHGHASTGLWEQLVRAGYMSRTAPAVYTGVKILLFAVGLLAVALIVVPGDRGMLQKVWLISTGGMVAFFIPNLFVLAKEKQRREEIRQYLPDVVDLLEICVSSGIGLDMAWNMVADEVHNVSPVLATAMDLSNFEMHLGSTRTEAMRNMAARTGADQLSSLAAVLVQSERFGTSVAAALREFAASMREERRMTAEESAEKMAVKLIIPMVLFVFPAVVIVVVGPAAVNIAQTLLSW